MQQFIADFNHCAELIRRKCSLTEFCISFRNFLAFVNPLCFHCVVSNRNFTSTAVGLDDGCHLAEDVIFFQCLNQSALKFIRHSIATLSVLTDAQSIADCKLVALVAHHIPECVLVLISCSRIGFGFAVICSCRSIGDGLGSRCCECRIHSSLLFKTFNFCAECLHLRCHLVVGFNCGSLYKTVLTTVLFKECLSLLPESVSLAAKFHNLAHIVPPFLPDISGGRKFKQPLIS